MRTRRALLAAVVAASIPGAAAAAMPTGVGSGDYPWVQPPAQVGIAPILPAQPQPSSYVWVQPPSWIFTQ